MSAARASGADLASSLKRNPFWTLGVRPGRQGGAGCRGGAVRDHESYIGEIRVAALESSNFENSNFESSESSNFESSNFESSSFASSNFEWGSSP